MKKQHYLLLILSALFLPITACAQGSRLTTNVTVLNEDGVPIEGAHVHIGYPSHQPSNIRGEHKKGYTDENGYFTFTGTASWKASVSVTKGGFYQTLLSPEIHESDSQGNARLKSKVEATITLREIRNPVPMYARLLQLRSPETEKKLGFDFFRNDWTAPHGEGQDAHVFIKVTGVQSDEGMRNIMEWHFPNDHDGIIRIEPAKGSSRFVWPYLAPDVGYNQEMRWQYTRPDALAFEENDKSIQNAHRPGHWIIRFNTKVDKDGEIISANYGKFYGRIFINGSFEQPGHPGFAIRDGVIYINPEENERAMEFKSDYNLAKDSLPPAALLLP